MRLFAAATLLSHWANFYVIAGSAAAALTGLQFVVVALIPQVRPRKVEGGIEAFSTPTIVHFSSVLLLSSVLSAPWDGFSCVAALVAVCGALGTGYSTLVGWRARRVADYRPVFEDWLWHVALPLTAYALLLAAGLALVQRPDGALFTIAAAVLLLLFIGIHNAWDTVTFLVTQRLEALMRESDRREPPAE